MLFRVKTQRYKDSFGRIHRNFHWVPVGTVLHSSNMERSCDGAYDRVYVRIGSYKQHVPMQCLKRIPNTKANLRKYAKGLL